MISNLRRRYQYLYTKLSEKWWIKIAFAFTVLGVGCSIGAVKYWISRVGEDQVAKDAFKVYANSVISSVSTNWGNLLLGPQMMANLFLTNYTITFETFARFSRPPGFWDSAFNYMQAIQFVPLVLEQDRIKFEQAAQCAYPGYYIRERDQNGKYIAAKPRFEHFPVFFNEPYVGNEGAMGLDNTATENRYQAYNLSRRTGQPSLSERILLVQVGQFGAFILIPIFIDYSNTHFWYPGCELVNSPSPILVRNVTDHIFGFVNGVLVYQNFFDSAVKHLVQPDIDVFIFDTTSSSSSSSSSSSANFLGHVPGPFSDLSSSVNYVFDNTTKMNQIYPKMETSVTSELTVADRKWTVIIGARKGYLSVRRTYAPLILLLISIFTSVVPVLSGFLHYYLMKGYIPPVSSSSSHSLSPCPSSSPSSPTFSLSSPSFSSFGRSPSRVSPARISVEACKSNEMISLQLSHSTDSLHSSGEPFIKSKEEN